MAYPTGYLNPVSGLVEGSSVSGTDATTNTTAIQDAINSANGPVVMPTGTYQHYPLTMKSGTVLLGGGAGGYGNLPVEFNQTHMSLYPGATSDQITIGQGVGNVYMQDICLDGGGHSNNASRDIIHVTDNSNPDQVNLRLERVQLVNSGNRGLYVGTKRDDVKMHHSMILNCWGTGLVTNGPDGVYDACEFGSNGYSGTNNNIEIGAVVNRVINSDIWSTPGHAQVGVVILTGITGIVLAGNGIDHHDKQGVFIYSGCYSVSVQDNIFHSNSVAANNTYAHCYCQSTNAGCVSFDGNVVTYDSAQGTNAASYLLQASSFAAALWGTGNYAEVGGSTPGVNTALHN